MEGDLKKVLDELDRLLIVARNAGMRMRLQDERENLRLPNETREFAWELSEGPEWGGSFTRARDLIRSVYPKQNDTIKSLIAAIEREGYEVLRNVPGEIYTVRPRAQNENATSPKPD